MTENVVVLTGAGVSPLQTPFQKTVASAQVNDPSIEKIFSPKTYGNFLPELWSFVREAALESQLVKPNLVHNSLVKTGWPIITDNVDGYHQIAGSYPVVELNGNIWSARCIRCQNIMKFNAEDYDKLDYGFVPACNKCGKERTRPDVVLPGEPIKHRRLSEDFVKESTTLLLIGVTESSHLQKLSELSANVVAVGYAPESIRVDRFIDMSIEDWAHAGCSIL